MSALKIRIALQEKSRVLRESLDDLKAISEQQRQNLERQLHQLEQTCWLERDKLKKLQDNFAEVDSYFDCKDAATPSTLCHKVGI